MRPPSSGKLRSRLIVTDVSEQRFGPIFKGRAVQIFLDCHSTLRNIPEDSGCLTLRKVVPNRRQQVTNLAAQHRRTGKISLAHNMFTVAPLALSSFGRVVHLTTFIITAMPIQKRYIIPDGFTPSSINTLSSLDLSQMGPSAN
jgi:hypothetical protein